MLLLAAILLVAAAKNCSPSREDAQKCLVNYVDLDSNLEITQDEIDAARDRNLYAYEKFATWLLNAADNDEIMRKCDADGDRIITPTDFEVTLHTCLAKCDSIQKLFTYICDREAKKNKSSWWF